MADTRRKKNAPLAGNKGTQKKGTTVRSSGSDDYLLYPSDSKTYKPARQTKKTARKATKGAGDKNKISFQENQNSKRPALSRENAKDPNKRAYMSQDEVKRSIEYEKKLKRAREEEAARERAREAAREQAREAERERAREIAREKARAAAKRAAREQEREAAREQTRKLAIEQARKKSAKSVKNAPKKQAVRDEAVRRQYAQQEFGNARQSKSDVPLQNKRPAPVDRQRQTVSMPQRSAAGPGIAYVDTKKRRKRSAGAKIFVFMLACMFVLAGLGGAAYMWLLRVKSIDVENFTNYKTEEVIKISEVKLGQSLVSLNVEAVKARICAKNPAINVELIKKSYPDKLVMKISERNAVAKIEGANTQAVISSDGNVIYIGNNYPSELVKISGMGVDGFAIGTSLKNESDYQSYVLFELLDTIISKELSDDVDCIDVGNPISLKLTMKNGLRVVIGEASDFDKKLDCLEKMMKELEKLGYKDGVADVSVLSMPIYTPADSELNSPSPSTTPGATDKPKETP